jgi:hypothetical protein
MSLFALLNSMAKKERTAQPDIYNRVVELRKRMSRIKLADSVDIGAGLSNVGSVNTPKFKYGMKGELDQGGKLTGVDLERSQKALSYTSILPRDGREKNTNEIVVSYREHEGDRFPLFTKWSSADKAFLCTEGDPATNYIRNARIPDDWVRTLEL